MDLTADLTSLLNKTDLQVTDQQIAKLVGYVELLDKWNKAYNLTSVRDPREMLVKHILDSLVNGPHLNGERFIDVGTGPGLPGIPLAILYPQKQFVLLDSLGKRITFLKQVVYQLKLENVTPVQSRVEEYQPEPKFDGVLSRAFASLQDMLSWCKHLVSDDGRFYALKGVYPQQEIELMPEDIELVNSVTLQVPELQGERHLIELKLR
ncbi:16S rRNA (guanine(527)-N(7))-methyltransferase RsmG [Thalassotalea sp. HSM 43]|uniref:16S rRNA (guanine(527)-N(7))-methyltransferase RsmG n=1 Tax=Thalassotalea sp. HSM 43 TaxID=2552945 RepID=UPI001080A832|nr:16S rRNA (guanine(527)-N(7))-methyltransferase RsmG [Thalassotalea sp. HSM 43]QBY04411.1 16S rRNA (guanine(527)-N(7))-methyltransferase RsmG [Thalassotalea sp. HSM 43]